MTNDDEVPQLSAETLRALQEFLEERKLEQDDISENWQLSQFWYDENTTKVLSSAILSNCGDNFNVALISCPTLYPCIKSQIENSMKQLHVILFEFDERFAKYDPDFVFYDYNKPFNVSKEFHNFFDMIVIDPPFLSEECLTKTASTVNLIKKKNSKIIVCTGAVMEELASKLLNVKKCCFEPKHKNNLGNQFICMSNFGEV